MSPFEQGRTQFRVVPFKTDKGEQMFTLVEEWLVMSGAAKGTVRTDRRHQLSEAAFRLLLSEVQEAAKEMK